MFEPRSLLVLVQHRRRPVPETLRRALREEDPGRSGAPCHPARTKV